MKTVVSDNSAQEHYESKWDIELDLRYVALGQRYENT